MKASERRFGYWRFANGVKLWKAHLLADQLRDYRQNRARGENYHEPEEERHFVRLLQARATGTVLDVGAGVGYYSILCRRLFPQLRPHAFNPDPLFVQRMRANLRLNRVEGVSIHRLAVSDRAELAHLQLPGSYSGYLNPDGQGVPVRCVTLAAVLNSLSGPVRLAKLDVQGAELRVLQGAGERLDQLGSLLVATHGPELHRQCLAYLRERGWNIEWEAAEVPAQYDGLIAATAPAGGDRRRPTP